jgi:hypothetical protein
LCIALAYGFSCVEIISSIKLGETESPVLFKTYFARILFGALQIEDAAFLFASFFFLTTSYPHLITHFISKYFSTSRKYSMLSVCS